MSLKRHIRTVWSPTVFGRTLSTAQSEMPTHVIDMTSYQNRSRLALPNVDSVGQYGHLTRLCEAEGDAGESASDWQAAYVGDRNSPLSSTELHQALCTHHMTADEHHRRVGFCCLLLADGTRERRVELQVSR